jgi:8-oxo-dGDP phosphatase
MSDFVNKFVNQGRREGEAMGEIRGRIKAGAEAVLTVLGARGIEVPDEVRVRITGCTDLDQLEAWLRRAATVESIDDMSGLLTGSGGHAYRVVSHVEHFRGPVFRVVSDEVMTPADERIRRDYIVHIGAAGVVALDEHERVVLVRQYRHPVGRELWELPAGLCDQAGEPLHEVALRELAEEADLRAGQLDLLVDLHTTPGCSDEQIRVFLARDLSPTPEPHRRQHEEAMMKVSREPLDKAIGMVFDGRITNATAVAGLLAAARARDLGWSQLRPADTPLPTGRAPLR